MVNKDSNHDQEINFDLLENSLHFILEGVTRLSKSDGPSDEHVKHGTINLAFGVELLLKERLIREHWTLIFQNVDKAEKYKLQSGDFTSTGFKEALTRVERVCGIAIDSQNRKALIKLNYTRNKFVHFGKADSVFAIKNIAAHVLDFVVDFMEDLIINNENDNIESMIFSIRNKLGEFEEFSKKRKEKIKDNLAEAIGVELCPGCLEETLMLGDGDPTCPFCNWTDSPLETALTYLKMFLNTTRYDEKDICEPIVRYCPICSEEAVIEHVDSDHLCFGCGGVWEVGELTKCTNCSELIDNSRGDADIICGDCSDYKMNKDD